jgi:hypothetical protein
VSKLKSIIEIALERTTVISSLQVGLVVGLILNVINQWNALSATDYHLLNSPKIVLTFLVPYLVSTYATIKAKL